MHLLNENVWISKTKWLKFVFKGGIDNNTGLVHIMAWCHSDDKPLSEQMKIRSLTHTCVAQPQWVNPEIRNMIHQPLLMVKSWNNGIRCMLYCVFIHIVHKNLAKWYNTFLYLLSFITLSLSLSVEDVSLLAHFTTFVTKRIRILTSNVPLRRICGICAWPIQGLTVSFQIMLRRQQQGQW